ncbi:MAG: hypothetical protein ABSF14_23860 [Terriglobia bacterium]|jgi:20S proteasome alpha/beta subunit
MTIAAGFKCRDGVLLCADSQITSDQGKTYQAKIFGINKPAGVYLTYCGSVLFAKELVDVLRESLKGDPGKSAAKKVRKIYQHFHHRHYTQPKKAEKSFADILITLRDEDQALLYHASGRHFLLVDTYQPLGIGREYGESLFAPFYNKTMTRTEAGYLAIYALWKIKAYVHGCGGRTHIREVLDDPGILPAPRWLAEADLKRIEADYEFFEKAVYPLIPIFPNRQIGRTDFQACLTHTVRVLKKHRAQSLRGRDLTMIGTWFDAYR